MRHRPIITVDGPAGAGKSTVSRMLAERLGFTYLDTGALYRAVALRVAEDPSLSHLAAGRPPAPGEAERLGDLARSLDLQFGGGGTRVWLGSRDVTERIRTPEISQAASRISAIPAVRQGLLSLQRRLGRDGGIVAEGRDLGSVVFPDAEVKFYLTASPHCRAERRAAELRTRGVDVDPEAMRQEIEERDARDAGRAVAPLRQPDEAIEIDSGPLSIEEVVDRMIEVVRSREGS